MRPLVLVLLLAAPLLAGCTSDGDAPAQGTPPTGATPTPSGAAGPQAVSLEVRTSGAYPVNPGFAPATLEAPAGSTITVTFTNAETAPLVPHDWVLEGVEGASIASISPGAEAAVTFAAPPPGEYVYFCSIGDHRDRGMEGTLTVA